MKLVPRSLFTNWQKARPRVLLQGVAGRIGKLPGEGQKVMYKVMVFMDSQCHLPESYGFWEKKRTRLFSHWNKTKRNTGFRLVESILVVSKILTYLVQ